MKRLLVVYNNNHNTQWKEKKEKCQEKNFFIIWSISKSSNISGFKKFLPLKRLTTQLYHFTVMLTSFFVKYTHEFEYRGGYI